MKLLKIKEIRLPEVRSIAKKLIKEAKKEDWGSHIFIYNLAFELNEAGYETAWIPLSSTDHLWIELQGYIIDVCDGEYAVDIRHYTELNSSRLHKAAPSGSENRTGLLPGQNVKNPKITYSRPYHLYDKKLWASLGYERERK